GANARFKAYPFAYASAAENLAMSKGLGNPAKSGATRTHLLTRSLARSRVRLTRMCLCGVHRVAVDGWIDSPGHRAKRLSNHNFCAIAVYRNASGAWYFTQLFARSL